jgi:hypothetical protein
LPQRRQLIAGVDKRIILEHLMYVICSVDTEADNQWLSPAPATVENIEFIPRFQELCDEFGFKPVYLVSYEIAATPRFHELMRSYISSGRAEIGAHLHPWSCPPIVPLTENDLIHHPFPHELPLELYARKMGVLTELLSQSFGTQPVSYRAGRWGICAAHIPVLTSLGYKVDSSVTPDIDWKSSPGAPSGTGGPDFRGAPQRPYFLSSDNINRAGDTELLEVPTTVVSKNQAARRLFLSTKFRIVKSVISRMRLKPLWLYPSVMASDIHNVGDYMIRVCKIAKEQDLPYIHLTIHSSELMPGSSPFWPNAESIEILYGGFRKLFEHLQKDNGKGITLHELYRECAGVRNLSAR